MTATLNLKTGEHARMTITADSEDVLAEYLGWLVYGSVSLAMHKHNCPVGVKVECSTGGVKSLWPINFVSSEREDFRRELRRSVEDAPYVRARFGLQPDPGLGPQLRDFDDESGAFDVLNEQYSKQRT